MYFNYLVEKFLPWSLKIEQKNTISMVVKEKEKYFCDMFNHFASSFKGMPTYELHMFRVSFSEINILSSNLISIVLPNNTKYHSVYIVYNDTKCDYFILNKTNSKFDLIHCRDNVVCGNVDIDLNNLQSQITNYIISK